jgi:TonB-linked SusC/RagA family outer membrane protein
MKKTTDYGGFYQLHKILRIMKMVILLLTIGISQAFAFSSYGQETRLDLKMENSSLQSIFDEIEQESEFHFFYRSEDVNSSETFDVELNNATISQILDAVLGQTGLSYKVFDKYIAISTNKPNEASSEVQQSQDRKIQGTVTDSYGEPMPGVTVQVKGADGGTITDVDGNFSLTIGEDAQTLVFSFIGMETKEIVIGDQVLFDIEMEEDVVGLDEVVVVGYGTMRKENVVGSVDQIQSSVLENKAVTNVSQALQGASANLIIQETNTEPGAGLNINIRGVGTMNNNAPLIVIDGMVGGDLNSMNPSDIESISVLKDAGSAAIYGSRSANGVIFVTTKKGAKNSAPQVKINSSTGIQAPHFLYEPVKGYENAILRNQALANSGNSLIYSPDDIRKFKEEGDNEWFLKSILQEATQQNHSISISGGSETNTYMISAGYMSQENNFVGPDYGLERYNFRMNMTNEYGRLKLTTLMSYGRTDILNHTSSTGVLVVDASRLPAYYNYSLKDENGRFLINDVLSEFNPLGILEEGGTNRSKNDNFSGNLSADLKLGGGLTLKGAFSADLRANQNLHKVKEVLYYSSAEATEYSGTSGSDRNTNTDATKSLFLNSQAMLDFSRNFNDVHSVDAIIGAASEAYISESTGVRLRFTDPDLNIPITETEIETDTYTIPEATTERSLNSVFGRVSYGFDQKYLAEFNFRYDGSSRFNEENRWGLFPSGAVGWRATEEDFLSGYRDRFGSLKLRASYGVLGNQSIADYQYQTNYFVFSDSYGFGNESVAGAGFTFANQSLRWEKSTNLNLGIDATYFDERLSFSLDYFNKLTTDSLIPPAVPGTYGGSLPDYNAGEMRNRGWEFTTNLHIPGAIFEHFINLNIADSKNEVTDFNGDERIESSDQMQRITKEGVAFNSYLGYKRDGYFQSMDEVQNDPKPIGATVSPGDIRFKDKDTNGVIDENDRFILGNAFPRYTFGLNYDLRWNNFDLGALIQGVGKREMFLRGELVEPFHSNYSYVVYQHQLDFWTPVNTDAKYPRLASPGSASNTNNFGNTSDLYIFDASYVRIKNLQLGYTLPGYLTERLGMKKMRVYANARNLLTVSNISFINPESSEFNSNMGAGGANSGRNYPVLKYYGLGLDITF